MSHVPISNMFQYCMYSCKVPWYSCSLEVNSTSHWVIGPGATTWLALLLKVRTGFSYPAPTRAKQRNGTSPEHLADLPPAPAGVLATHAPTPTKQVSGQRGSRPRRVGSGLPYLNLNVLGQRQWRDPGLLPHLVSLPPKGPTSRPGAQACSALPACHPESVRVDHAR